MPRKLPQTAFDFKAARKARKVSQQKAAEILHATQPSISRWETDGSMPDVYKMAWLLYWQLEDSTNGKTKGKDKADKRLGTASRSNSRVQGGSDSRIVERRRRSSRRIDIRDGTGVSMAQVESADNQNADVVTDD